MENKIIQILYQMADEINISAVRNERYLHHDFVQKLIAGGICCLDLTREGLLGPILLPELPTSSKYRKNDNKYYLADNGSPGFIDIAVGTDDLQPKAAIEFCFSGSGWPTERVCYNLLKLLDPLNNFECSCLFSVFKYDNNYSDNDMNRISRQMTDAVKTAKDRIGKFSDYTTNLHFFVVGCFNGGKLCLVMQMSGSSDPESVEIYGCILPFN
ncbi:MAG: hypothetical protein C4519_00285 [Desulfobacteraceae bacterium]|nr:MAG: hypothetical protein C4519_00285 [Desulfobacteraceae bacterium]